jgi:hypothetical protein
VVEIEARQAVYRLQCSNHFKKSDWGHSAIFKMAKEDSPFLLAPSDCMLPLEVFDSIQMVACLRAGVLEFFFEGT